MSTTSLVSLQPDSLYVATQTILSHDGSFIQANFWHWSFFITDARGHTVQHHWTVRRGDQRGVTTECYQYRDIREVSCVTALSQYVVFAKIGVWSHPGAQMLKRALDALYKNYEGPTDRLRRHPDGLRTCRTWVMDALLMFVERRWLVPRADSVPAEHWLHAAVHDAIVRASYAVTAALLKDGPKGFRSAMLEIPTSSA
ncbi:hypothetical protein CPB85DRAFT_1439904 [Mucidula mucida]|nr:hypothetical protein CPB85DRAFT_1439904 [Mucidula mucida]